MLNHYKLSVITMLLLISGTTVFAQRTVTGKVTDPQNEGLPGASVLVKGTTTGSVTDMEGNYSIEVSNDQTILVFSFIGYSSVEESVGSRSTINVTLNEEFSALNEVVVTGYGSQSRREITGAVTSVDSDKLLSIPATTFAQQLQGRAAGVTIVNDATPGGGATVRIQIGRASCR